MEIMCNLAPRNLSIYSLFARARSNQTRICPSSPLVFYQVNGDPIKPKSWKAHRLITTLNPSICLAGSRIPPLFFITIGYLIKISNA